MMKLILLSCCVVGIQAFGGADCGDAGMEQCLDECWDCVPCWFAEDASNPVCKQDGPGGCTRCNDCQTKYASCVSDDCLDPVTNMCRIACGICAHCLVDPDGPGCDSARCQNCDDSECAERARSGFINPVCANLPAVNTEKLPTYCAGDEYDNCKLTCSSCVSGMLCDQLPSVMDAAICQNIVAKTDCTHCDDCQKFVICAGHDCDSDYINQCEDSHFCGECYECIQHPDAHVCTTPHCTECANYCGWVSSVKMHAGPPSSTMCSGPLLGAPAGSSSSSVFSRETASRLVLSTLTCAQ